MVVALQVESLCRMLLQSFPQYMAVRRGGHRPYIVGIFGFGHTLVLGSTSP